MDTFFTVCLMSLFADVVAFGIALGLIVSDRPRAAVIIGFGTAGVTLVLWAVFTVIAIHTGYVGPGQ